MYTTTYTYKDVFEADTYMMGPDGAQMGTWSPMFPQFPLTWLTLVCPYQMWHCSGFQTAQSNLQTHHIKLYLCVRHE